MHPTAFSRTRHLPMILAFAILASQFALTAGDDVPAPPAAAPPQPILPADIEKGAARLHLTTGETVTVKQLMIHQEQVYGQLPDGQPARYSRQQLKGIEANAPLEATLTQGPPTVTADQSILEQSVFYFKVLENSVVAVPDRLLSGLYPPDRFMIYPDIFKKYVAPWGKIYDQRPFYLQLDFGYVLTQSVDRSEVATGHLVTGSDIGLWRIRLEGSAHHGRTNGYTSVSDQTVDLKIDRYLASWLYGYAKTGLYHDDVKDIEYRWTQGAGAGLGTFELTAWTGSWLEAQLKYHKIDFEFGVDHLQEKNRDGRKSAWFLRLAAIDQIRFATDIDFDNRVEYLAAIANSDPSARNQYFVHYRSELRMNLMTNLAFRAFYSLDFNSTPPTGTPKTTHQIGISLGFSIG